MSLESNHAAAGTAATTARAERKQEWYKKPTAIHFAIGAGIIAVALIINFSFTFNFFWKLLLGGALIWGGGQMKKQKINLVKVWGNILRGLGWVIVIVALLNSGVRAVAERAVTGLDSTLSELATGEASDEVTPSWRSWFKDNEVIPIDLRRSQIGETTEMNVLSSSTMAIRVSSSSREVHGFTYTWACPVSDGLKFNFENGKGTTLHHFTVSKESQKRLGQAKWIKVYFTTVLSPENPCAHLNEL